MFLNYIGEAKVKKLVLVGPGYDCIISWCSFGQLFQIAVIKLAFAFLYAGYVSYE